MLPVFRFCNPVTKIDETGQVTDIVDRRHHLTMYFMLAFPPSPPREFIVDNQFGREQRIRTTRAVALGVPTEKNSDGPVENLDHFKVPLGRGTTG